MSGEERQHKNAEQGGRGVPKALQFSNKWDEKVAAGGKKRSWPKATGSGGPWRHAQKKSRPSRIRVERAASKYAQQPTVLAAGRQGRYGRAAFNEGWIVMR